MKYIPRVAESTIKKYLTIFPVVGITGPRQSGKSTMLQKLFGGTYRYVSFDDLNNVALFHDDPKRFMRTYSEKVIFDEVQRVPEIFNAIKQLVDEHRDVYGRFIVTGSSQFAFMKNVSESLAGRIGLLSLLPFQYSEIPNALHNDSIFKGAYPELVTRKYEASIDWYASYLDTYLTRDVRSLREIGSMRDFRRCLQLLASRTSQILNMSDIGRDIGVSTPTIRKWISVLEASYILFLLPPHYKNYGKRVIKSPKVYFFDTGLVSFLTGIRNTELFEKGPMYGALFENYIVSEIVKKELHTKSDSEFFYCRTSNGVEVDLIIDRKSQQEYIEIKSSETFRPEMTKAISQIKKKNQKGYLLYRGRGVDFTKDLEVLNYKKYLTG
ncbi:MAG: ATP-binding protein [bacterium]